MSATRIQKAHKLVAESRLIQMGASRLYFTQGFTGNYNTFAWPFSLDDLTDERGAELCTCEANKVCCHAIAAKWEYEYKNGES